MATKIHSSQKQKGIETIRIHCLQIKSSYLATRKCTNHRKTEFKNLPWGRSVWLRLLTMRRAVKNVVVPVFPFGEAWRAEWCSGAGPPRDRRVDKLLAVNVVIYVTMTSWWRRHLRHHVCAGRARHRPHYRLSRRQHSLPSPQVAYHTSRGSSGRPTGGGPRATQPMRPHEKPHDKNLVVSQTFQSLLLCYWLVYSHILRLFMSKFLYILYIIVYFCIYF